MTVAALAGRRIDAVGAPPVFPAARIPPVRSAIRDMLRRARVTRLIASAASGADLLALDAAATLGIATRIVLPFAAERFRRTSVADRPGDWPALFDRALARAGRELVTLEGEGAAAYRAASARLIEEAVAAAAPALPLAIVVWDGVARAAGDHSAEFVAIARAAGCALREVRTRA